MVKTQVKNSYVIDHEGLFFLVFSSVSTIFAFISFYAYLLFAAFRMSPYEFEYEKAKEEWHFKKNS